MSVPKKADVVASPSLWDLLPPDLQGFIAKLAERRHAVDLLRLQISEVSEEYNRNECARQGLMRKLRWRGLEYGAELFAKGPLKEIFGEAHVEPQLSISYRARIRIAEFFDERCFYRPVWGFRAREHLGKVRNIDAIVCLPVYRIAVAFEHFGSAYCCLEQRFNLVRFDEVFRIVVHEAFNRCSLVRRRIRFYES